MTETSGRRRAGREGGGRDGRRAARAAAVVESAPFIERKIPYLEYLDEEGLQIIEENADLLLEEIGIDFLDDPEALEMWQAAGADVKGCRVHFPRGLCRSLIQATAPREYLQHARNPARSVMIGGKRTVLVPASASSPPASCPPVAQATWIWTMPPSSTFLSPPSASPCA